MSDVQFNGKYVQCRKQVLGQGSFGAVYAGSQRGKQEVAVKKVLVAHLETVRDEAALQQLDHANLVKFLHQERNADFKQVSRIESIYSLIFF